MSTTEFLLDALVGGQPYDTAEKRGNLLLVLAESVEHLLGLEAEREATPPSATDGDEACGRPFPTRYHLPCDKPAGHDGPHWHPPTSPSATDGDDEPRPPRVCTACGADEGDPDGCDLTLNHDGSAWRMQYPPAAPWRATPPPAPAQGEAAVEALTRVLVNLDGSTYPHDARGILAALDRGAVPGYGPTGASINRAAGNS